MKSKSSDSKSVGIAFEVSGEQNVTLTNSAIENERAKKREAKLRLEDHLKRFPQANWKEK